MMPDKVSSDASCWITEVGLPHENNITARKAVMLLMINPAGLLLRGSDGRGFIDPAAYGIGLTFGIVVEEDGLR